MLDGLERADWPTKLHTNFGVLDRHVQHHLGAANLLGSQRNRSQVEHLLEHGPATTVFTDELGRGAGKVQASLLAGLVHGGQWRAGEAIGVARNMEQRHTGVGAGGHDDLVGHMTVEHVHL